MPDISSFLEQQAQLLFDNVAGWETSTLERIARKIKQICKLSVADVQALNNAAFVKQNMKVIMRELAKVTKLDIKQIEKIYGEALAKQHLENKPLYDYRNKTFVPFEENKELQAIVRAYSKSTAETMINLSNTSALGVIDDKGNFIHLQKAYADVLDKAVVQVSSGTTDFYTAMRESIRQLGGSGIRVDYGSGVTRQLDTVVRQNIFWGAKQASIEYQKVIGEELECDGIEIDWHANSRPSHEFMQGRQFCRGKSRVINGIFFQSADEPDPKSPDNQSVEEALNDYGCRHFPTDIICGVSVPTYSKKELAKLNEQNNKEYTIGEKTKTGYGWTQSMRKLESEIRKQKTIKDMAIASGDEELKNQCSEQIKKYTAKYKEISEATGISQETERMRITKRGN